MRKLILLLVVVALMLLLVTPAVTAQAVDEKPTGVKVINEDVLAAPGTSAKVIAMVAADVGLPPPHGHASNLNLIPD